MMNLRIEGKAGGCCCVLTYNFLNIMILIYLLFQAQFAVLRVNFVEVDCNFEQSALACHYPLMLYNHSQRIFL